MTTRIFKNLCSTLILMTVLSVMIPHHALGDSACGYGKKAGDACTDTTYENCASSINECHYYIWSTSDSYDASHCSCLSKYSTYPHGDRVTCRALGVDETESCASLYRTKTYNNVQFSKICEQTRGNGCTLQCNNIESIRIDKNTTITTGGAICEADENPCGEEDSDWTEFSDKTEQRTHYKLSGEDCNQRTERYTVYRIKQGYYTTRQSDSRLTCIRKSEDDKFQDSYFMMGGSGSDWYFSGFIPELNIQQCPSGQTTYYDGCNIYSAENACRPIDIVERCVTTTQDDIDSCTGTTYSDWENTNKGFLVRKELTYSWNEYDCECTPEEWGTNRHYKIDADYYYDGKITCTKQDNEEYYDSTSGFYHGNIQQCPDGLHTAGSGCNKGRESCKQRCTGTCQGEWTDNWTDVPGSDGWQQRTWLPKQFTDDCTCQGTKPYTQYQLKAGYYYDGKSTCQDEDGNYYLAIPQDIDIGTCPIGTNKAKTDGCNKGRQDTVCGVCPKTDLNNNNWTDSENGQQSQTIYTGITTDDETRCATQTIYRCAENHYCTNLNNTGKCEPNSINGQPDYPTESGNLQCAACPTFGDKQLDSAPGLSGITGCVTNAVKNQTKFTDDRGTFIIEKKQQK